jgi:hypothetical protein
MLFTKLKAAPAIVLALGFVATGATIHAARTAVGENVQAAHKEKQATADKDALPERVPAELRALEKKAQAASPSSMKPGSKISTTGNSRSNPRDWRT